MTARRHRSGDHDPRHEAETLIAAIRHSDMVARRMREVGFSPDVEWDTERPIPLGGTR